MITAPLDKWAVGYRCHRQWGGSSSRDGAMRIVDALRVRPARTIRVGLWTGEEQGLLGHSLT